MIAFFDTSAFVPLVLEEPGTPHARALWNRMSRAIGSVLLHPEAKAAIGRAHRTGRIDSDGRTAAYEKLEHLVAQLELLTIDRHLAARAAALTVAAPLRGPDAVHLAAAEAAASPNVTLVAGDAQLCDAARRLGLAVAQLRPGP